MARIEWVEQRLQNWARWKLTRGGVGNLGYAAVNLAGANAGRDGYVTATVPTNDCEASETDDAVMRLYPGELRITVIEYYCGRGGLREKLARLCCAEPPLHARLERAQRLLSAHFAAREDAARAERARVEALHAREF